MNRLGAAVLVGALLATLACRSIESPEELQGLTSDPPQEASVEVAETVPANTPVASSGNVDVFPLVGPVFPGLGGQLHSSLCDPASDPYSTCI